jgi:hypothetical protein
MNAVGPEIQNTTTLSPAVNYSNLAADDLIPVDTEQARGQNPQTVAATAFQVAAQALALIHNTGTSTAAAVTMNVASGSILTEALTTAVGSDYAFILTNSLLTTAVDAPQVQVGFKSCTAGLPRVKSVVNASGSSTITITNDGTAAFNGTILMGFHV